MYRLVLLSISSALGLHALGLSALVVSSDRGVLALPGAVAVEVLALVSVVVFLAVRMLGRSERRVASVSIFVSSLVLSLAAPALFLPLAATRGEWWAMWGRSGFQPDGMAPAFGLWGLSMLIGGLAMHLLLNQRWRRLQGHASAPL